MSGQHRIKDISFSEGWCECTCGLMVTPEHFSQHRQSVNAGLANRDVAHNHDGGSRHPMPIKGAPQRHLEGALPQPHLRKS